MAKLDDFKIFVKNNPNLVTYVKKGDMSWQKFYEIYDLYGEDNSVWKDYLVVNENRTSSVSSSKSAGINFNSIIEMAKNMDTNKLQDGITSIQKAISLFGDMFVNNKTDTSSYSPRPIYRKFDD